ncbi:hypothetical protein JXR93_07960 [bacterium]|nr:hypothetical protein [bacterium]
MKIKFNGFYKDYDKEVTIREMLVEFNLHYLRAMVYIDGEQILSSDYDKYKTTPDKNIEVVYYVAGG